MILCVCCFIEGKIHLTDTFETKLTVFDGTTTKKTIQHYFTTRNQRISIIILYLRQFEQKIFQANYIHCI
jgi:hypothetical protein